MTTNSHILGFPRIGAQRELKFALESFWRGDSDVSALQNVANTIKTKNWQTQINAQLTHITVGDFAFYDQMLNQSLMLGCIPKRFGFEASQITLAQTFDLARGNAAQPAMEMTKWFDTNYHYLVPELAQDIQFKINVNDILSDIDAVQTLGGEAKPVIIGPLTYLWLAKIHGQNFNKLDLLPALTQAYGDILKAFKARNVTWVQIDEPILSLDLPGFWLNAFDNVYTELNAAGCKVLLTTYFEDVSAHITRISKLPVQGIHIDGARAPQQITEWVDLLPTDKVLSIGLIDGRNIWRADVRALIDQLQNAKTTLGERLWVGTSCSLLHTPVSLEFETKLDPEIRNWLAFATEKVTEINVITRALNEGNEAVLNELIQSDAAQYARRNSKRVTSDFVRNRLANVTTAMSTRVTPFAQRIKKQQAHLNLPLFPTTSIGSFPQTTEIRQLRAAHKRGEIGALDYLERIREHIKIAVEEQEKLDIDVLVHGEAERNDMVEFFGEHLWGYVFTANGWVQSYGSRCVKPPVIYGDIYRPEPMTVDTTRYAQSLTNKPMKGMLTGPITMLQWSFVRDDQPRELTALQLALAIRDEVQDLEAAGITVIQIDEPALREGLPLKRRDWAVYLEWAVRAFRLSSAGVADTTQIHTHMCYSEFNDILPNIAAMDADVITIETSRSNMKLLKGFGDFNYPNDIGPGVYDIHSPRVPSVDAMTFLLERACEVIPAERLWVNPDCGLKTRGWEETRAALSHMVSAAKIMRKKVKAEQLACAEV